MIRVLALLTLSFVLLPAIGAVIEGRSPEKPAPAWQAAWREM